MGFSQTYGFAAPPEVVFNTIIDPARAYRWLPAGAEVEMTGTDHLSLRAGGRTVDVRLIADMRHMKLTAVSERPQVRGDVRVEQAPAGGSELRVDLTGQDADRWRPLVDQAVGRLRRDVADNFNPG